MTTVFNAGVAREITETANKRRVPDEIEAEIRKVADEAGNQVCLIGITDGDRAALKFHGFKVEGGAAATIVTW